MKRIVPLFAAASALVFLAGCASYDQQKIAEWQQAHAEGKLSYFELEQLKVLQRQGRGFYSYPSAGSRYCRDVV